MTDTILAPPALGERITHQNANAVRQGDYVHALHKGRHYFGVLREIVNRPNVFEGSHIAASGVAGPLNAFTFVGRPRRDGWMKFQGDANPVGDAVIEAWLVTGAVMRKRACDFPDVAWKCVITHIRPYIPPPIPTVETVEQVIAALAPFAEVVRSYDAAEDDSHEIWTDHGFIGGPATTVFRLENYRRALAALEALTGKKQETI